MTAQKLLVVEDEFLLAFEMEAILSGAGYEVLGPVATVAKALALISREKPGAAFLDCNLNGEHTAPVALALSAEGIPFAVVTGYDIDRLPDAFHNGLFVSKPFTAVQLLEIARQLLTLRQTKPAAHPEL
jgi:DNA-binding NtrC family response regulator